jgi:hypothetical protein
MVIGLGQDYEPEWFQFEYGLYLYNTASSGYHCLLTSAKATNYFVSFSVIKIAFGSATRQLVKSWTADFVKFGLQCREHGFHEASLTFD